MDKEIKKYIAAVRRKLNLPRKVKNRVLSDLQTTITARMEGGETWAQVEEAMGTPAGAAAELNGQMKEFVRVKSPWRFAFLAAAVIAALELLPALVSWLLLHTARQEAGSVGIIGGADGPTAIFVTAPSTVYAAGWLLVLAAGIAGFLLLRRCKPKK